MPDEFFAPLNPLETLMIEGVARPDKRPEFYRQLLEFPVITVGGIDPDGRTWLQECTYHGETMYFLFTSPERLHRAIPEPGGVLQFSGRQILQWIPPGVPVMINVASTPSIRLEAQAIASLLSGTASQPGKPREIPAHAKVYFRSAAAAYPASIIDALTAYFRGQPDIELGYLGEMEVMGSGEPAHPVVGIKMQGSLQPLLASIDAIIKEHLGSRCLLDVIPMDEQNPIAARVHKDLRPFYIRVNTTASPKPLSPE